MGWNWILCNKTTEKNVTDYWKSHHFANSRKNPVHLKLLFTSAKPDQSCYSWGTTVAAPAPTGRAAAGVHSSDFSGYTKRRDCTSENLALLKFFSLINCQSCPVMLMPKIITPIYLQNKSIHPVFPASNFYASFLQIFPVPNNFLMLLSNKVSNLNI